MRRALIGLNLAIAVVLPGACSDDAGNRGDGATIGTESETTADSGSEVGSVTNSTSASTSTASTTASTTDDPSTTSTETTETDTNCPLGQMGCPCDSGTCDEGLECMGGTCNPPGVCNDDPNEPNDDEDNASFLGDINDDDDNGSVVVGVLDGSNDIDWLSYHGADDFGSTVDPERMLQANAGLRLCKFFECDVGLADTDVTCPMGTQAATSPGGKPGCCDSDGFVVDGLNCLGVVSDDATVYIRVDEAEVDDCVIYSIDFHY